MAAKYHFLSTYRFWGDLERVWATIAAVESWPQWWSWLRRVDVLRAPTRDDGLGAVCRHTMRTPSGYGFVFETECVTVERLRRVDVVSSGDIVGRGRLAVEPRDTDEFDLRFAWLVETPKRWMTLLAPIARPLFTWNHALLMDAFGKGLAEQSGTRLVSSSHTATKPGAPGFWVMPEPHA